MACASSPSRPISRRATAPFLAEQVEALGLEVRTLINNAGFGLRGAFADQPLDRLVEMLELNTVSLTRLTGIFLPAMRARREGGIINVASIAAFQPGPYMSVYYASKAYVLSFSEAIAHELRGSGVVVTALCPGRPKANLPKIAGMAETLRLRRTLDVVARGGKARPCGPSRRQDGGDHGHRQQARAFHGTLGSARVMARIIARSLQEGRLHENAKRGSPARSELETVIRKSDGVRSCLDAFAASCRLAVLVLGAGQLHLLDAALRKALRAA